MIYEQLDKCDEQSFKLKLLEIGLSLNAKSQNNGEIGINSYFVDIPFATNYFDIDPNGRLAKIFDTELFRRQNSISQLQFLVHEKALNQCQFTPKLFPHQQSEHAKLATCLGVAILLRHSVDVEEVLRFAVAVAYHDAAAPLGRDTVIRLNRKELCEEKNFSRVMLASGMDKLFADISFSTGAAQISVYGHDMLGKLLDFVDKLSYTLLDVHHGLANGFLSETVQRCVNKNFLFGNVWLDVILTKKKPIFLHARRLYYFLLIRGLMHDTLYKNPAYRKLEIVYSKAISDDLKQGIISCEDLMQNDDHFLRTRYNHLSFVEKAKKIRYRSFKEGDKALRFIDSLGGQLVYMEEMSPFKTGLKWLVKKHAAFRSLRDMLHSAQAENLELLAQHRQGWHLYFI